MDYYVREEYLRKKIQEYENELHAAPAEYDEVIGGDVYTRRVEMSPQHRRALLDKIADCEEELERIRIAKQEADKRRRERQQTSEIYLGEEYKREKEKREAKKAEEEYVKSEVKRLKKAYKRHYGLLFRTARAIQGNAPQFERLGKLSKRELDYLENEYIGGTVGSPRHHRTKKQKEEAKRYIERVARACKKSSYDIKKEQEAKERGRYYR